MFNFKSTLLLSIIALSACGGGGGGGDDSAPPVTTSPVENGSGDDDGTTTPTLPTAPAASYTSGGKLTGWTYTTPEGREYVLRGGISVGGVHSEVLTRVDGTRISQTSWCCGRMSYTNYGTWTDFINDKHEVFYTGDATATASVPTQGAATYSGSGMREGTRSDAVFNVDFAAKTINGTIAAGEEYGSAVAMQGKISDGGFSGSAQSGGKDGTFIGHFNGPAAEELGGVAQFTDSSKNTAFGATKQ